MEVEGTHHRAVCEDEELCVCDAFGEKSPKKDVKHKKDILTKTNSPRSQERKRRDLELIKTQVQSRQQIKLRDSEELKRLKEQVDMKRRKVRISKSDTTSDSHTETQSNLNPPCTERLDYPSLETKPKLSDPKFSTINSDHSNRESIQIKTDSPSKITQNRKKSVPKKSNKPKLDSKYKKRTNVKSKSTKHNGKGRLKRTISDTMINKMESDFAVSNNAMHSSLLREDRTDESLLNLSLPTPRSAEYCSTMQDLGLESMTPGANSSDSDEDLPEGWTPIRCNDKVLSVGDLIWAKFGTNFYLPAIVKYVYKKKQRATVVYFAPENESHKPISMCYRCILPFMTSKRDEILQEGENLRGKEKEMFKLYMDRLEDFLSKKANKMLKNNDVWSYFKPEELDLGEEEEGLPSSHESMEVEEKPKLVYEQLSKKGEERKARMSDKTKPLTDFLISDTTKEHLRQIFKEETSSELNKLFKTGSMKERSIMKHRGFGPLDDEKQIETVLTTFLEWLQEWNKSPYLHKINYVFDVLVPEAIVNAFVKTKGYSRKKAWEMFDKGVRRTKEELQLISKTMLETIDSEDDVEEDQFIRLKPKKLILK